MPLAIGTETAGSLVYPASQNHVVTIKPTVGLVSRDLIVPISGTQDTAGPIANRVADAWHLLKVIQGPCPHDLKTHEIPQYLEAPKPPATLGLLVNKEVLSDYRDDDQALVSAAIARLKRLGYSVVEIALDPLAFETDMFDILLYEFYRDVSAYLDQPDVDSVMNLEDIIAYNEKDLDNRAAFGQVLLKRSVADRPSEARYREALERSVTRTSAAIAKALNEVDVLMTVSNYATALYATPGFAALCVPMGFRPSGEPVGLTFFAGPYQEQRLVAVAEDFEVKRGLHALG